MNINWWGLCLPEFDVRTERNIELHCVMKTKLVFWGTNATKDRVLIALELLAKENKVKGYVFKEPLATEGLDKELRQKWKNSNAEFDMPDGHEGFEKELTVTGGILPEGFTVEQEGILNRAQTEWHFVVLSAKLHENYASELEEIKEKIERLTDFDGKLWDSLKGFWSKVQAQAREKNLFREHEQNLRDSTNVLFSQMKDLRAKMDEEINKNSKVLFEQFNTALDEIEEKIQADARLSALFEDLKKLQRKFNDSKLNREHRSKIWQKLDGTFKKVKEKRFGPGATDASPVERIQRRLTGLNGAIEKMERSIKRDKDELSFQERKIARTDGQLEAQIRQAKIKMIEERVRSKEEKLGEMLKTKAELEKRIEKEQSKAEQRQKIEEAKKAAKDKIAEQMKEQEEKMSVEKDKLLKAAEAIAGDAVEEKSTQPSDQPKQEDSEKSADDILGAVGATLGEALEDVVDTVKAIASVVSTNVGEMVDEIKEDIKEELQEVKEELTKEEE